MDDSHEQRGKTRHLVLLVLGVALVAVVGVLAVRFWSQDSHQPRRFTSLIEEGQTTPISPDEVMQIESFCGDCHTVPLADSFPRYAWHQEVSRGYAAYARSGRQDLDPPPMALTVAYYTSRAPQQLTFPTPEEAKRPWAVSFHIEKLEDAEPRSQRPAVADLRWVQLQTDPADQFVVSDMRRGTIHAVAVGQAAATARLLARLDHPAGVHPCDLDGDSAVDLIVADLGSYVAKDHDLGRVVWLRRDPSASDFECIQLAAGMGRVADVRSGDFDGDGDLDLVVAEFGHERTGGIHVLWNVATADELPKFESEVVDPRPGAIHVPPYDLNGDGNLDFFGLVSQEHEQVAVFMNQRGSEQPTSSFYLQSLWEGPDLTFGSSGLYLTDLDQDGDVDLLYTNGDAFDNSFVNPRHGVQWLENRGRFEFAHHRLTDLVGAYKALPGDIDADGDLDVIAVAWLPQNIQPANAMDRPLASIVCLEQIAPRRFVRRTLEKGLPVHATLELADFDSDGDLDFAVGHHWLSKTPAEPRWVDIWWNQLRKADAPAVP